MTHLEDSRIIALFFERSEQAIAELDNKYGSAIKKTAANILNDRLDVEECVNDTYLRTWNNIPPQKPSPLVSYVCKIARNLALDRYSKAGAQKRGGSQDESLLRSHETQTQRGFGATQRFIVNFFATIVYASYK